jgi:hypothetical protein
MRKTAAQTSEPAPTHHRSAGWRYILVELGIVTAGLFIALMLNSVVEWARHKQLVNNARRNIQREIVENRHKVRENIAYMRSSLGQVDRNIASLQQIRARRFTHGTIGNGLTYTQLADAAWQTARNTGALSYMPYDEAQRYSGLYSTIAYVNGRAQRVAEDQFNAAAPVFMGYDLKTMPQGDLEAMLRGNAQAKIGVFTLVQMLGDVDQELAKDSRPSKEPES